MSTSEPPREHEEDSKKPRIGRRRFRVALSFPREYRLFAEAVAQELASNLGRQRVFYDKFYEAELARVNLDLYLQRIYHDDSDLLVVFICEDYEKKDYCRLEWRAMRDLMNRRREGDLMPIKLDDGEIAGLFPSTDGYVPVDGRSAQEIADLIVQRVKEHPSP